MGIEQRIAEQRKSKIPHFVGSVEEEADQERADIDPSRVGVYETPEYKQRAVHMRKKAHFGGDYNRGSGNSTSSQMRSLKMRTEKPRTENNSLSEEAYGEELDDKDAKLMQDN